MVEEKRATPQRIYINSIILSIGLQNTLLFKRPDFGLKYLVTITPKVQSLKFKSNT